MSAITEMICAVQDIPRTGCREFSFVEDNGPKKGFLVRRDETVFAYLNACPHTGAELNWQPDRFLDSQQAHILCGLHGALFEIDTGLCVLGPCRGDRLQSLPLCLKEGKIYLDRCLESEN